MRGPACPQQCSLWWGWRCKYSARLSEPCTQVLKWTKESNVYMSRQLQYCLGLDQIAFIPPESKLLFPSIALYLLLGEMILCRLQC